MDDLNKRVLTVMDSKKLSRSAFANLLEISLPVLTHIGSGRNKPGVDLIQKILIHFKDIDPDWLITGTGNMLRTKSDKPDINEELTALKALDAGLQKIDQNSRQVVEYNALLLKEINYLQELNEYMFDNKKEVDHFKSELQLIYQKLLEKVND